MGEQSSSSYPETNTGPEQKLPSDSEAAKKTDNPQTEQEELGPRERAIKELLQFGGFGEF